MKIVLVLILANYNCDAGGNYISYCDIENDSSGNKQKYAGYEEFSETGFEYQFDRDGYPVKEMIDPGMGDIIIFSSILVAYDHGENTYSDFSSIIFLEYFLNGAAIGLITNGVGHIITLLSEINGKMNKE